MAGWYRFAGVVVGLAVGLVVGLMLSVSVYAVDNNNSWKIENARARATAPGQNAASVDFSITSKHSAKLVGVSSPFAKTVELHSMTHENGMMKMRAVQFIELPAGKRVNLGESGYHLMLSGLKKPLNVGDNVPLTLNLKVGNSPIVKVETRVEVTPLNAAR